MYIYYLNRSLRQLKHLFGFFVLKSLYSESISVANALISRLNHVLKVIYYRRDQSQNDCTSLLQLRPRQDDLNRINPYFTQINYVYYYFYYYIKQWRINWLTVNPLHVVHRSLKTSVHFNYRSIWPNCVLFDYHQDNRRFFLCLSCYVYYIKCITIID